MYPIFQSYYYILVQGFSVTCVFTGQYNNKGYDTIADVILRHVNWISEKNYCT